MRLLFVVIALLAIQGAVGGDPDWIQHMDAVTVKCSQTNVPQEHVPFVGFLDECDDETKVIYEPVNSAEHLDMVIDPRNSDTVEWDTARYKRYGTYWPTANVTWHVPAGFTNFWARIYYANNNDKKFEPMKYQYSKDGVNWVNVPNVNYDQNMVCIGGNCNWYVRKEETASWTEPMFYWKAIWPAPCAGEIGATYAADQRRCLSLPPPGWTGTIEEFDASPMKDLYYTPQMAEIVLGRKDTTPEQPTELTLTPLKNAVLASWKAPAKTRDPIISYTVYYQIESTKSATDKNYKPPYLAKFVNVGLVNSVILSGLDPTKLIIVRVAAITIAGSGQSTMNVWAMPLTNGDEGTCPAGSSTPYLGGTLPTASPTTETPNAGAPSSASSSSMVSASNGASATANFAIVSSLTLSSVVAFILFV